jgi:Flp pilus assembly pilin Flp
MIMQKLAAAFRRFTKKEDGMVTVEWLALAAAVTVGAVGVAWTLYGDLKTGPGTAIIGNIDTVAGKTTAVPVP